MKIRAFGFINRIAIKKFEFNCFGGFNIKYKGADFKLSNSKAAELLSFLLANRKTVSKKFIAQNLWSEKEDDKAMDSLYKVCRYFRDLERSNIFFPIYASHGTIGLDEQMFSCDIYEFQELYEKGGVENYSQAVLFYKGALLKDKYYDWIVDYEGYFDIMYIKMVSYLVDFYKKTGNAYLYDFYRALLS